MRIELTEWKTDQHDGRRTAVVRVEDTTTARVIERSFAGAEVVKIRTFVPSTSTENPADVALRAMTMVVQEDLRPLVEGDVSLDDVAETGVMSPSQVDLACTYAGSPISDWDVAVAPGTVLWDS